MNSWICARRGVALVCLAIASMATLGAQASADESSAAAPLEPIVLHAKTDVVAYAPKDRETPRPVVTYVHGRCGAAWNGCPYFREGSDDFGWLVCPSANESCGGGGVSWSGSTDKKREIVDEAVNAVAQEFPGSVDANAPGVMIGFSQGAWVALDVLRTKPAKYMGVLFIGADVQPKASDLRAAKIERVVLASGAYDGARPLMEATTKRLVREGIDARYVSLGLVGHTYAPEVKGVLETSLRWLEGRGDAPADDASK